MISGLFLVRLLYLQEQSKLYQLFGCRIWYDNNIRPDKNCMIWRTNSEISVHNLNVVTKAYLDIVPLAEQQTKKYNSIKRMIL